MDVLFSRCLLGAPVRWDGGSRPSEAVIRLMRRVRACSACPETESGLTAPRPPAELRDGRVVTREGEDRTEYYVRGSRIAADRARGRGCRLAVLKSKSPACGYRRVYDGSFSGRLVPGNGILARMLTEEGVVVADEKTVEYCEPSVEHPVAIVLGSGLAGLAERVDVVRRIPYRDIDGFPEGAHPVRGHHFEALVGTIGATPVVVYPGRVHLYQGYGELEVTSLVRHAHKLGCRDLVLTCASGSVRDDVPAGTVGLITDHLNLTGRNPLANRESGSIVDSPFVPMAGAYSDYLGAFAKDAASEAGFELVGGVYAGLLGPTYETAAEVRMLNGLGASFVGMSTVNEAIMARALGMQVLGLTLVTNMAGRSDNAHAEVLQEAEKAGEKLCDLVCGVLARLGSDKA